MPKASNINPTDKLSLLLKGGPGEGKTIAACTFAIKGPVWLAYFDKQAPVELINFFKKNRPDLLDRIDYDVYNSSNCNEYLNKLMDLAKTPGKYVTGITDSVTNLTSAAVNWSMAFRGGGRKDNKVAGNMSASVLPDFDEYKVETSLVTQAIDLSKVAFPINIWIAHPLPQMRIEGTGSAMKITKSNSLVSYGSKVAGIIPGNFTEIYHFSRESGRRIVWTDMVGDDFAKSSLGIPNKFDVTDKLFYEVWSELVNKRMNELQEVKDEVSNNLASTFDKDKGNTSASKWKV